MQSGLSEINLGRRTLVIRDEGDFSIMPEGQTPVPILATKITIRWDLSEALSIIGVLLYQYDNNFTNLVTQANGTASLEFEMPHKIGAMLVAQARF